MNMLFLGLELARVRVTFASEPSNSCSYMLSDILSYSHLTIFPYNISHNSRTTPSHSTLAPIRRNVGRNHAIEPRTLAINMDQGERLVRDGHDQYRMLGRRTGSVSVGVIIRSNSFLFRSCGSCSCSSLLLAVVCRLSGGKLCELQADLVLISHIIVLSHHTSLHPHPYRHTTTPININIHIHIAITPRPSFARNRNHGRTRTRNPQPAIRYWTATVWEPYRTLFGNLV
jgi:hypothetical protein